MLRLCLDVNVWVAHYLAVVRRPDSVEAAGVLARSALARACPLGPVQLILSHAMLDTLEFVLRRMAVTAPFAEMARDQIEASTGRGYLAHPPSLILGGSSSYPLLDPEDSGVLNAAMAGAADLLVTGNIADFVRGSRARTSTVTLGEFQGRPDVVRLSHPKHPAGLVIASPFQAAAWLQRNKVPPPGVLTRFYPPDNQLA
jgi:predicted nucleic acid-binding protein